ncbi:adenylate/guanylate cyclase domain-containing protein [Herpetosiphon giganteus]|uniref:adenylate/guanylate cyclase domain-containing protein n=1 Tax=Herpetosiphon giganteus TaxID=2029754 RepID=UPI00195BB7AA|nr:adenylate/guanylate cyclase domain-containing protein [Herpetosiphon giganteus]MBM7844360.1 adenylate cyclase [Herpetosiphon giganteus]
MARMFQALIPRLRLHAGLALLLYVTTHLLNHVWGIFGLDALESARRFFLGFWRHPAIFWVVPASLLVHIVLSGYKLLTITNWRRLHWNEWLQLSLSLIMPLLISSHVYATRFATILYGVRDTYSYVLLGQMTIAIDLYLLLVVVWLHGNLGLLSYLWHKPWFRRIKQPLLIVQIVIPLLAMVGIIVAHREVNQLKQDPAWIASVMQFTNPNNVDLLAASSNFMARFGAGYAAILLGLGGGRALVLRLRRKHYLITVEYKGIATVTIPPGTSLLEASLANGIPHAHSCGGRGRCSTCRIEIIEGAKALNPPNETEQRLLKRFGAGGDIRLACQTIPTGACVVRPLLHHHDRAQPGTPTMISHGADKQIVIMFADLRGFTTLSEGKLPYDTVFILNQYFQSMGQVIESNGGYLDKFIGDGIMALFGLEGTLEQACHNALAATQAMAHQLDVLNQRLQDDVSEPLRMGIGIHCGHVIVGDLGYKRAKHLTAIGDAVNIAARLEEATKTLQTQLVVSRAVMQHSSLDLHDLVLSEIPIRGRIQPLEIYSFESAKSLVLVPLTLNS